MANRHMAFILNGSRKGTSLLNMQKIETKIFGAFILEPKVFGDNRGYFMETFSQRDFESLGLTTNFVQDNQSFTAKKGTLRGIHFQNDPMSQCKVVRVTQGVVRDFAIDLRKGSPTYLQWQFAELSEENKRQFYLPKGCGHGFVTVTDDVVFCYKVDAPYSFAHDRSIRFDDPALGIDWGITEPILSEKDQKAPVYADSDCNFIWVH